MKKLLLFFTFYLSLLSFSYAQINFAWTARKDMGPGALGRSISTDNEGNVIVSGPASGLYASYNHKIFIQKYNSHGELLWNNEIKTKKPGDIYNCIDHLGNIYVTGYFEGWAIFDKDTFAENNSMNLIFFVAKYNASGALKWVRIAGDSNGGGQPFKIIYHEDHLFVLSNGGFSIDNFNIYGYFIAKINPSNGKFLDVFTITNNWNGIVSSLEIDKKGNFYISGPFYNSMNVGDTTITGSSSRSFFIAKLDSTYKRIWAIHDFIYTGKSGGGGEIKIDEDGDVYMSGSYSENAVIANTTLPLPTDRIHGSFLIKYDGTNGKPLWLHEGNCRTCEYGTINALNFIIQKENIYVTGSFNRTTYFDDNKTVIVPKGTRDTYVARYLTNGVLQEVIQTDGMGEIYASAITKDNNGNIFITGNAQGNINFGDTMLPCGNDLFVAKIKGMSSFVIKDTLQYISDFKVYPNPTGSLITISYSSPIISECTVTLKNQLGQCLMNKKYSAQNNFSENLDLSGYAKGVYFIELVSGDVREVKKVVVN